MDFLARIAEKKISEALKQEDFTPKGWKDKPLVLDDTPNIPEDMKIAYKILKNSGYLPPEIEQKKEINKLEELIAATEDEHERLRQMKKLQTLLIKLDSRRGNKTNICQENLYYQKLVEKISLVKKN